MTLATEKINAAYQKYQQERLAREAEQQAIEKFRVEQKAQTAAYWQTKKPKTRTVRKPHTCAGCKQTISTGSKATIRLIEKDGCHNLQISNRHFETLYYCENCKPVEAIPA